MANGNHLLRKSVEGKTDELENRERNRFNKSEKGFSVKLRDAKTRHTRNAAAKENTNVKLLINDVVNVYGTFKQHTKLLLHSNCSSIQVRRLNNQTFGSSVISKASHSNGKPKKLILLTKQIVCQSYKCDSFSCQAIKRVDSDVVLVWPRMWHYIEWWYTKRELQIIICCILIWWQFRV